MPDDDLTLSGEPRFKQLPLHAIPVTRDTFLRVTVWNLRASLQVNLQARMILFDGRLQKLERTFIPSSDGSISEFTAQLTDGWLIGVAVSGAVQIGRRGETFCQVGLQEGAIFNQRPYQVLIADYITFREWMTWPGGLIVTPFSGRGLEGGIRIPDPGAGNEISFAAGTNRVHWVKSVRFVFTCSATVATRRVKLNFEYTVGQTLVLASNQTQVASQAFEYNWSPYLTRAVIGTRVYEPLMPNYYFTDDATFQTLTDNLQAGDAFSDIQFESEQWIWPSA